MLEVFARIAFYLCTGFALAGGVAWYISSVYQALVGHSQLVIVPFTIADNGQDKADGRREALAKMLHARLQQIEYDLTVSQQALLAAVPAPPPIPGSNNAALKPNETFTSIAPPLFAT